RENGGYYGLEQGSSQSSQNRGERGRDQYQENQNCGNPRRRHDSRSSQNTARQGCSTCGSRNEDNEEYDEQHDLSYESFNRESDDDYQRGHSHRRNKDMKKAKKMKTTRLRKITI